MRYLMLLLVLSISNIVLANPNKIPQCCSAYETDSLRKHCVKTRTEAATLFFLAFNNYGCGNGKASQQCKILNQCHQENTNLAVKDCVNYVEVVSCMTQELAKCYKNKQCRD